MLVFNEDMGESQRHMRSELDLFQMFAPFCIADLEVQTNQVRQDFRKQRRLQLLVLNASAEASHDVFPRHVVAEAVATHTPAMPLRSNLLAHEMSAVALQVVNDHCGPKWQDHRHLDPPHFPLHHDLVHVAVPIVVREGLWHRWVHAILHLHPAFPADGDPASRAQNCTVVQASVGVLDVLRAANDVHGCAAGVPPCATPFEVVLG